MMAHYTRVYSPTLNAETSTLFYFYFTFFLLLLFLFTSIIFYLFKMNVVDHRFCRT